MNRNMMITGGSGLLALNWGLATRDSYNINLVYNRRKVKLSGTNCLYIQLNSIQDIEKNFKKIKPHVVIHTVGLTNIETCESNPKLAKEINVDLADSVSKVCAKLNIKLVHISTDHLFSGNDESVDELYPIFPKNIYAKTKAEAEKVVNINCPDSLIIRTNFYGFGTSYRSSFSDIILNSLQKNKEVSLFTDVFYTPIYTTILIKAVHDLIDAEKSGVFNIVSDERLSKYDFGIKIANTFGFDNALITKGKMADQSKLISRPFDMSLSNKKVCGLLGRKLGNVDEHIKLLFQHNDVGNAQEIQSL